MLSTSIATIEAFPNELFIELFEYFSPFDLYNQFFNLNSRLNSIIYSIRHFHYVLHEDWDDDKQHTVPFFASQVSTLIIKNDDPVDFSLYPNLRSLKLTMPTAQQCNAIRSFHLPNLEHLSVSNFFFFDHSEQLCALIFSSSLSRLKTCRIDRMTFHSSSSSLSLSLRELTISPCTWKHNMYEQIFRSCPKLTHLRIQRLRNISFQVPSNVIPSHTSLRQLTIHFCSIGDQWYNQIKSLLTVASNLEILTLRIDHIETNTEFPFDLFTRLLTEHVPNLIELRAKIPWNQFLSSDISRSVDNYLFLSSKHK